MNLQRHRSFNSRTAVSNVDDPDAGVLIAQSDIGRQCHRKSGQDAAIQLFVIIPRCAACTHIGSNAAHSYESK